MRSSGILMHISSLPGSYGIGTMGKAAYAFVDFLKAAGQQRWQILPLNPTGYGDSPYQSCSTFAGNPYLIDPDLLVEEGLLTPEEPKSVIWSESPEKVDYFRLYQNRWPLLRKAYERFPGGEEFDRFCTENGSWLSDYGLYMALKDRYQGKPWYEWDRALKFREPNAIWDARQELKDSVRFYSFVQYLFFRQWNALHAYAKAAGIAVIGDVPIYVPLDSVDVWSNPELFRLDAERRPEAVAGCPPDAFTADGQLWGNPLYRWDAAQKDGYGWWIRRLSAAGNLYDIIRLDHFRGFAGYWAVPYGDETARGGKWMTGPGMDFIAAVQKALPELTLIAEDLGYLTPDVLALRDDSGLPGMKVLQFAFDTLGPSEYQPHRYIPNTVCYTGTHDNMTTRQWLEETDEKVTAYARKYLHASEDEGVWAFIRAAFASVSELCIVPIQDYLNLGGEARMNFPGTLSNSNWTWRAKDGMINIALAEKIRDITVLYERAPEKAERETGEAPDSGDGLE